MTKIYDKFALVYDRMGADHHSMKMVHYCFQLFRRFHIHPVSGLDLCCGTGTAIQIFSDKGILMSGLDQSPRMLAEAARKLKGRKVTLYQKTLPRFKLLDSSDSRKVRQFDLVTSFYDSLNYLKNEKELKAAFQSVCRHLAPNGWFIFDMNTPSALKVIWGGQVYADIQEGLAWIWKNDFLPQTNTATCHTTFFKKKGMLWERFDEEHTEKGYDNQAIKKLLKEAGFRIKGFYRCFSFETPTARTNRICAVAQKLK